MEKKTTYTLAEYERIQWLYDEMKQRYADAQERIEELLERIEVAKQMNDRL